MVEEECRVRVPDEVKLQEGEQVTIKFDESNIHLFQKDIGRNILRKPETHQAKASDSGDSVIADD